MSFFNYKRQRTGAVCAGCITSAEATSKKTQKRIKKSSGFTLAELLVVIMIIAILAAIAIPVFSDYREKAARATDATNARILETMFTIMLDTEEIVFPAEKPVGVDNQGVYIVVCRDESSYPKNYKKTMPMAVNSTVFCGADKGITIRGETSTAWNAEHGELEAAVRSAFGNHNMHSNSTYEETVDGLGGWDWYVVECYLDTDKKIKTRTYSGKAGMTSGISEWPNTLETNIEKYRKTLIK